MTKSCEDAMSGFEYAYVGMHQQSSLEAVELLWKATVFRFTMRPEQWARDVERKALRKFERSFELRNMLYPDIPRPDVLPVGSYMYDKSKPSRRIVIEQIPSQAVSTSPSDAH